VNLCKLVYWYADSHHSEADAPVPAPRQRRFPPVASEKLSRRSETRCYPLPDAPLARSSNSPRHHRPSMLLPGIAVHTGDTVDQTLAHRVKCIHPRLLVSCFCVCDSALRVWSDDHRAIKFPGKDRLMRAVYIGVRRSG